MRRQIVVLAALLVAACTSGNATPSGDFVDIPGLGTTRIDVPRPSTHPDSPCAFAIQPGESVEERVGDLRALGLFRDRPTDSNEIIANEVRAAVDRTFGIEALADDLLGELIVAAHDETRVWWFDLEADVVDGNRIYEWALAAWGAISVGVFAPSDVTEAWQGENGPVTVTFNFAGEPRTLMPAYLDDWIDPMILTDINALIAGSGRQFRLFKAFGQDAYLLALTGEEQAALESRGWCFE
jgi:hypothetical protein